MRAATDKGRRSGRRAQAVGLTDAELADLCSVAFKGSRSAILGVSGGLDSMTLLLAAQCWRAAESRSGADFPLIVATVDHGLRAGSFEEARWVAEQAKEAGFPHHILAWTGEKPRTRIQETARAARYGLLVDLAQRVCLPQPVSIVLAHHLDDQAETFLMRLARGSGVDGLAAVPERRRLAGSAGDIHIVRPLLGLGKERLRSTLRSRGLAWLEDPSNDNPAYERVRVRRLLPTLAAAGVGAEQIGAAARRLARARDALEQVTGALAERIVDVNQGAIAVIDLPAFLAAPAELRVRLLQRVVRQFGGRQDVPARLVQIEKLADEISQGDRVATLGGCRIARVGGCFHVVREPGRKGLPEMELPCGAALIWDNRFLVTAGTWRSGPLKVRAMPAHVWTEVRERRRKEGLAAPSIPRAAALTLPSFWDGDRLVAIPHPGFAIGPDSGVTAIFLPA